MKHKFHSLSIIPSGVHKNPKSSLHFLFLFCFLLLVCLLVFCFVFFLLHELSLAFRCNFFFSALFCFLLLRFIVSYLTEDFFFFHVNFPQLLDITEQPIGGGRELKRRKKLAG